MNTHVAALMKKFHEKYPDAKLYEKSLREGEETLFFLTKMDKKKHVVEASDNSFFFHPMNHETVTILRKHFSSLNPQPCGMKNSFGFGDRLGIASPGHVQALNEKNFFPIFAQQSGRELERTGRTFESVLDDAILGIFEAGFTGAFGADADHAKDFATIKAALQAGYTFYTIDPSAVIQAPNLFSKEEKEHFFKNHWDTYKQYADKTYAFGHEAWTISENILRELALTYGPAIDFIEETYRFLKQKTEGFDFEVSVDETTLPTSPEAHILIVEELRRRHVDFQNLALRFPGRFEKGVDYKGSLEEFDRSLFAHQTIREHLGPYKISLHSGSDKFSIYPIFRKILGTQYHVKTSGTSWIEAIRAVAIADFDLFSEILRIAINDFETNAASYEISANPRAINLETIKDSSPDTLFESPDIRQTIHIAYGSILGESGRTSGIRDRLYSLLEKDDEIYYQTLKNHLGTHVRLLS
jgi:hypothetical protein